MILISKRMQFTLMSLALSLSDVAIGHSAPGGKKYFCVPTNKNWKLCSEKWTQKRGRSKSRTIGIVIFVFSQINLR